MLPEWTMGYELNVAFPRPPNSVLSEYSRCRFGVFFKFWKVSLSIKGPLSRLRNSCIQTMSASSSCIVCRMALNVPGSSAQSLRSNIRTLNDISLICWLSDRCVLSRFSNCRFFRREPGCRLMYAVSVCHPNRMARKDIRNSFFLRSSQKPMNRKLIARIKGYASPRNAGGQNLAGLIYREE